MRNLWMALLGMSLFVPDASAQGIVCSLGPMTTGYSPSADQAATPRAARDLKKIVGMLCPKGCGRVGLFKNPTTLSAMALNVGHGTSKIAYSAAFLDRVQDTYGTDASFGILAHEVGHHVDVNGDPAGWMDAAWNNEARADAWAGCAVARAGLRIEGLKGALRAVGAPPSGADPGWELRAAALQRGYESCGGNARLRLASVQTRTTSAKTGGCSGNAECRAGRVCQEGRCQERAERGVCLKDIDCPERQICGATGRCESANAGTAAATLLASAATVVSWPQDQREGTPDADCRKQCDADRRHCRIGAMKSLNQCLDHVRTDREYVGCACPSWPANKPECHGVCEEAFEGAERCESEYAPIRQACLATTSTCGACEPTTPGRPVWGRESALK